MARSFSQTLISATRNINLDPCEFRAADVAPRCPTPWSVRKLRLRGGRQEGVDLIVIDNGALQLRICPTRGMGVIDATMGDLRLGWDSPVKEIVHPALVNANHRGGTGWLEGFNEYIVRCGLEWFGPPCQDTHHGAAAEPPAANVTLHGKIANIPASEVEFTIETAAPFRLTLRGVVHETMMYGPKFRLTTEIITEPDSPGFEVRDTVENIGGQAQEMSLLYHINHGRPLLGEGSRLVAPIKSVCPRDAGYPRKDIARFDRYSGPRPGATEQAYLMRLYADRRGQTSVVLHNARADRAVEVSYPLKPLPCFTLWKGIHHELDGYVTGLEPATGYPLARPVEREGGRIVTLRPGRAWSASLGFALHADKAAVKRAAARVKAIAAGRRAVLSHTPSSV